MLNPEKRQNEHLTLLSTPLPDVATLPWDIKKSFSSDYLR